MLEVYPAFVMLEVASASVLFVTGPFASEQRAFDEVFEFEMGIEASPVVVAVTAAPVVVMAVAPAATSVVLPAVMVVGLVDSYWVS